MAQCAAKSSRSGKRCRAQAIRGGTVCRTHGGSAPQVRNAAAKRIERLVDPAIDRLLKSLKSKNEAVSLRAAQDILDRNGLKCETIIRLLMPGRAVLSVKLSDEQADRIRNFSLDELAVLYRILGYIQTGEGKESPAQVN
jgi:hypothetical protein